MSDEVRARVEKTLADIRTWPSYTPTELVLLSAISYRDTMLARARAEVERLRGLLQEWTDMDPLRYDSEYSACPWCNFDYSNMRHEPDCAFVLARAACGIGEVQA